MESWKSVAIWSHCGRRDKPHRRCGVQHPDNCFRHSGDGHVMCEAHSYPWGNVCECLCHESCKDHPDTLLVVWGNCQDWCRPEILRPCTCLQFSGKWIISMINFIADIVHQALAKISSSCAAMVYCCKTSIDSMCGFWTQLPTEIRKMVVWPLSKNRFTCHTNIREICLMFPSCWIIVLTIKLGAQVSICRDWNCWSL